MLRGILIFLVLFVVAGAAFLMLRHRHKPDGGASPTDPAVIMPSLARETVAYTQNRYGITLDFSPASIVQVQDVLDRLHADHQAGDVAVPADGAPQRLGRFPDQIRPVERNSGCVALDREWSRTRHQFETVVQRNGLEYGAQLVEPVGAGTQYTQIQVDLGVSANDQRRRIHN